MPYVKLIDYEENPLFAGDDENHRQLPAGVSLMRIQNEDHSFDRNYQEHSYANVLALIRDFSDETVICIRGVGEWSPEYLTLLVQIAKVCTKLKICDMAGDLAFGCFAGALMQQDYLRELNIESHSHLSPMSSSQAKLLFAGVASCPSLEVFRFCGSFADNEVAACLLIDAIQQFLNLRSLDLSVTSANDAGFLRIFQTAVLKAQVEHLSVRNYEERPWRIPFQRLAGLLCREDCAVRSLDLGWVHPIQQTGSPLRDERQDIVPNMSVKSLVLEPGVKLGDTLGLFGSLVILTLCGNTRITSLDPLYPLLIGEHLTLQSLIMCGLGHNMAEHVAILFCKLPLMTCLRELDISSTSFCFESCWWMTILELTLWQNKSLECFYFEDIQESEFDSKLSVPLSLNRGGRRAMEIGPRRDINENLWPLILERASRIHYYDFCSTMEDPDLESTRVDVVHWLLRIQRFQTLHYCRWLGHREHGDKRVSRWFLGEFHRKLIGNG